MGMGLIGVAARPQPREGTAAIKPIESLWLTSPQLISNASSGTPIARGLKEWRRIFDAIMLLKLPPTFVDDKNFASDANGLIKEVGGEFVLVTLPVGTEGWESSANQRLAQRQAGAHYDASQAVPQLVWMETLKGIDSKTWAWVLEQPARMPTPEQAAKSASEFVKFAKTQRKKAAIWLSAEAFGVPRFKEMTKRVCEATVADTDYFGWMDLPADILRSGGDKWRDALNERLDQILAMTPKEKTIIQWSHNPNAPTKDVAGTTAYISACQAKGINRFCLLSAPQFLDREPWQDFYRNLPTNGRTR
jgi:hypothetical protein